MQRSLSLLVRPAALLAVLALLACSRQLDVPDEQKPKITGVAPLAGFTGEYVSLSGSGLGTLSTTIVRMNGVQAAVVTAESTSVTFSVPKGLSTAEPIEIELATPLGKYQAEQTFTYLGLGHPDALTLRATVSVAPNYYAFANRENLQMGMEQNYGLLIPTFSLTGSAVTAPVRISVLVTDVWGTKDAPWVYQPQFTGDPAELHQIDLTATPPREVCNAPHGFVFPVADDEDQTFLAAGSGGGTRAAVPTGGSKLLAVDLTQCPPLTTSIDLGAGRIQGLAFSGETTLVGWTVTRPFRVELSATSTPAVFLGQPFSDPFDTPRMEFNTDLPHPHPQELRLAYIRGDDDVGFMEWPAGAGPPTIVPADPLGSYLSTYTRPMDLAWAGTSYERLQILDNHGLVVSFDHAANAARGSQQLDDDTQQLLQIRSGLAFGDTVAASKSATVLLSPDAVLLRKNTGRAHIQSPSALGLGPDLAGNFPALIVANDLDVARLVTDPFALLQPEGPVVALLGVRGTVRPVGWTSDTLYGFEGQVTTPLFTVASGRAIRGAARTDTGTAVAALTVDDQDTSRLELFQAGGAHLELPLSAGAADRSKVLFRGDELYLAASGADPHVDFSLTAFTPGTLTPARTADVSGSALDENVLLGLWDSPRFDSVFCVIGVLDASGRQLVYANGSMWDATGQLDGVRIDDPLTNVLTLSRDGTELLSASPHYLGVPPGVDAAPLGVTDSGELGIGDVRHQDLPALVGDAVPSASGDRYYVSLPDLDSVGLLQ